MRQAPTPAHASTARRLHARAPTPAVPVRRAQEGEEAQVGQEGEEEQEKQEEQEEQGQRLRLGLTRGLLSRSLHGHSLTRRRRHVAYPALAHCAVLLSSSVHFGCHVKREEAPVRSVLALCIKSEQGCQLCFFVSGSWVSERFVKSTPGHVQSTYLVENSTTTTHNSGKI